jgi:hypothetical protein
VLERVFGIAVAVGTDDATGLHYFIPGA